MKYFGATLAVIPLILIAEGVNPATDSYSVANWSAVFSEGPGIRIGVVGLLVSIAIVGVRKATGRLA
jgi:hypothetical protein